MQCGAIRRRLYAPCIGIIALGVVIAIMSAASHELACVLIIDSGMVILSISALLALDAAYASIIGFAVIIIMMSARSRELTTIVRRMRKYCCLWRGYSRSDMSRRRLHIACLIIIPFRKVIVI